MLEKAAKRNCNTRQEAGWRAPQQEDGAEGADDPQWGPTQSPGPHPVHTHVLTLLQHGGYWRSNKMSSESEPFILERRNEFCFFFFPAVLLIKS